MVVPIGRSLSTVGVVKGWGGPCQLGCWPLSVLVTCEDIELTAGELDWSLLVTVTT